MSPEGRLEAVIFDVDGTLVDSERHGHRVAFNQAFEEAGLPYSWDEDTYGELLRTTGGQRRLHRYLEQQGMDEDERAEVVPRLHGRKSEIFKGLVEAGKLEVRPGAARLLSELQDSSTAIGVVTTGSGHWVRALLGQIVPDVHFDVMDFGDDVSERKPHPEAYDVALDRLEVDDTGAVAVEDSEEGLEAAQAAGLPCVVVVNGYTEDHDLSGADLVLDGFGEDGLPAGVLADPHSTGCGGILRRETLEQLVGTRSPDGA